MEASMKTHRDLINESLYKSIQDARKGNEQADLHVLAWSSINHWSLPVRRMIESLADYADTYFKRYESRIGDDGVFGEAWLDALRSVRILLNGEIGRLDGGTVDSLIVAMSKLEGRER